MNRRQRFLLAALTGVVAAVAAEALQGKSIAASISQNGVTLHLDGLPLIGDVQTHLAPSHSSSGGSSLVVLPADAQATQARMHKVAAAVGVGVALGAFVLAGR